MKRKLWIMLALAALIAALWCAPASAAIKGGPCGADGSDVYYSMNLDTGELIISGNGAMADCVYDKDKEKFILPWGDKITKVIIEEGVTEVGKAAFYKCGSLKEVVFPEGLTTIKPGAFYECKKLETVDFPEGLTTIGEHAFESSRRHACAIRLQMPQATS